MSLVDALLLEAYRDPHDVWIALRSDGLKGSGTLNDPYDGGTRFGPTLGALLTCNRYQFIVGTDEPHDLTGTPDVMLSGGVGVSVDWFQGSFTVQALPSSHHIVLQFATAKTGTPPTTVPVAPPSVAYSWYPNAGLIYLGRPGKPLLVARIYWPIAKVTTTGGVSHGLVNYSAVDVSMTSGSDNFSGTQGALGVTSTEFFYRLGFLPTHSDVTNGDGSLKTLNCNIVRRTYRFDEVMKTVPVQSLIHLGPGVFETRGFAPLYIADGFQTGWELKSGQRLVGSGLDVSVVRLAVPMDDQSQTTAIASRNNPRADSAEVAGITVDCNAPAHVAPYGIFPAPVTCGAVGLYGSHIRLYRVRAVNFCVQASAECFPLFLSSPGYPFPAATNNIIEDCIVEMPGENNTHETTLISAHGDLYGDGRSCVVRHNFHSAAFANGWTPRLIPLSSVSAPTGSPPLVTLTTSQPHAHTKGKALVVQGVKVGGNLSTVYNGIFTIVDIVTPTVLTYRLSGSPESGTLDASGATIGGAISSEWVGITGITYTTESDGTETAIVETSRPHRRNLGQNVKLDAVYKFVDSENKPSTFNDTFPIMAIVSPTQFKIVRPIGAPSESELRYFVDGIKARLGCDFMGRGSIGGTGCVTEGNAYHDCLHTCYQDTGSTRDMVLRDNYGSKIATGVSFNMFNGASDVYRAPSGIIPLASGSEKRGVFTSNRTIPFAVDALVTIREAGSTAVDSGANPYHGLARPVKQVETEKFQYLLANQASLPGDNCPGNPVFGVAAPIASLAFSASPTALVTIVTSPAAHGLQANDYVLVVGTSDGRFNGFYGPITLDSINPTTKFSYPVSGTNFPASGSGGSVERHVAISTLTYSSNHVVAVTATAHGLDDGDFIMLMSASVSEMNGFFGPITRDPMQPTTKFSYAMQSGLTNGTVATGATFDRQVAAGIVRSGTLATVTTVEPHNYFWGQAIRVLGTFVDGIAQNGYNRVGTVTAYTARSFSYEMKAVGGSVPSGTKSPVGANTYAAYWDVRNLEVQANICDLYSIDQTTVVLPRGLAMAGLLTADIPPYLFSNFIWSENVVRHIDEQTAGASNDPNSYGIRATTIGRFAVSKNLIDAGAVSPLEYRSFASAHHLDNKTNAGKSIHGFNEEIQVSIGDLETILEELHIMTYL